MTEPLKAKELVITDEDGVNRTFVLSRLDAITAREVITQYPSTALPKLGNYADNEALMLKLLSFVLARTEDGKDVRLSSRALIINHVPDFDTLFALEKEMMKHNFAFFRDGRVSNFFDDITQMLQSKISETLTSLLGQYSPANEQHSTNSEPSTT